jgi:hypothetical protein
MFITYHFVIAQAASPHSTPPQYRNAALSGEPALIGRFSAPFTIRSHLLLIRPFQLRFSILPSLRDHGSSSSPPLWGRQRRTQPRSRRATAENGMF